MNFLHRLSIRWILISGILLAVMVVIVSVTTVVMSRGKQRLEESSLEIANKVVRAHVADFLQLISFNTADVAADTVVRLESFPEIKDVLLYDTNGVLAFSYHNSDTPQVSSPDPSATALGVVRDGYIHLLSDVTYQDFSYGRVYLRMSADAFEQRVQTMRTTFSIVVSWLLIFSVILAVLIERAFSGPLLRLTDAFRRVSQSRDYSLRVPVRERNEFRVLNAGFNEMLERIEHANSDLQGEKERLQVTLHAIADGVLTVRVDGTVEFLNPAAERLLGVRAAGATDARLSELMTIVGDGPSQVQNNPALDVIASGRSAAVATFNIRMPHTGRTHIVDASSEPLLDEHKQVTGAVLVLHDVTESRVAEEQKRQALRDKTAADAANSAKSTFLAHMSHEIRTPMTAVLGFAETMLDVEQSPQERQDAVQRILRSGHHLLQVINDILDISKVEAGKLEAEKIPVSLFGMLADVESLAALKAKETNLSFGVVFDSDVPVQIISDPVRLKQVLINLCSNAVKFTEHGGVTIHVRCIRDKERIEFDVVDTGIGLSGEQAGKLFQAFSQADSSTTRKFGGTGLGLSLSKKLAALLGGDLVLLSSTPNQGSCFQLAVATGGLADVEFARDGAQILNAMSNHAARTPAGGNTRVQGRILLAEDTKDLQELVSRHLRKMGANVSVANNGQEAMNMAQGQSYDLVLMDMQMPVMGGLEATQRLRAAGYLGPIVALTANAMRSDEQTALDAGCDMVLTKPVDWQRLATVVCDHLPVAGSASSSAAPLLSLVLHEEPDLADLVARFIRELPDYVTRLAGYAASENWPEMLAETHKLKGMGGSFGYPLLTDIAAELESAARLGNVVSVQASLLQLRTVSSQIVAGLPDAQRYAGE